MPVVYITRNLINGKKYIGFDSKNDPTYLGSGKILKKAIEKYGRCNFIKTIVMEFNNSEDALKYEKELIIEKNAVESDDFYNIHIGGRGGWGHIDVKGKNNPMFGVNLKDQMIKKYGDHEAEIRYSDLLLKKSKSMMGKNSGPMSEDSKKSISEGKLKFYLNISENKRNELGNIMSIALKSANIRRTDKYKDKMRKSILEISSKIHKKSKCVHCGMETNISNITRWHNDNCKIKKL
jgi:hypothetical protein